VKTGRLELKKKILSILDEVADNNKQPALLWIFKYMK
jgi:hypothetical protein